MSSRQSSAVELREIRHFHLFCGLGGGARGFNRGSARVGNMQAVFPMPWRHRRIRSRDP